LERSTGIDQPDEGRGKKIWVLSRAFYYHSLVILPEAVKGKKRVNLLNLQIQSFSPFEDSGSYAHWADNGVCVWFWNQARVKQQVESLGFKFEDFVIIPESALVKSQKDGLRLLKCLDGYEAQMWDQGQLMVSRWWPVMPEQSQWMHFYRSIGAYSAKQSAEMPDDAITLPIGTQSWARQRYISGGFTYESLISKEALAVLLLLIAIPFAYEGGKIYHYYNTKDDLSYQISVLEETTRVISKSSTQAEKNVQNIKKIISLDPYPHPLTIMARVAEVLPNAGVTLRNFKFARGKVEMQLKGAAGLDAAGYVESLERVPYFEAVNADPGFGGNTLKITFTVKKIWI
jgi:hypothetical protein